MGKSQGKAEKNPERNRWQSLNKRMATRRKPLKIWDEVSLSRIEHEILAVTDYRPDHGLVRWKYLIRLAKEADKVDDDTWETSYSQDTQEWIDDTIDRFYNRLPPREPNKIAPAKVAVSTSAGKKKTNLTNSIRDIVCKDPDIKVKELKEILEERGLDADQKSVPVIHSYTKRAIKHALDNGYLRKQDDVQENP